MCDEGDVASLNILPMWGLTFCTPKLRCLLGGMRKTVRECCRSSFVCGQGEGTYVPMSDSKGQGMVCGGPVWRDGVDRAAAVLAPELAVVKMYHRVAPKNITSALMLLIVSHNARFSDVVVWDTQTQLAPVKVHLQRGKLRGWVKT